MKTLFQIETEEQALLDLLENLPEDADAALIEAIDEHLAGVTQERTDKVDSYAALIRHLKAQGKARREEAARITELARADENRAARLEERLQRHFETMGIEKMETLRFKLSLVRNGGKVPLLFAENFDPAVLPDELKRVKVEADKDAITKALTSGQRIDGVTLGERGQSLRIK